MEKTELQLLNRIFQDAQIGMLAIDKILKKLENEKLKTLFKKQFESYEKFGEKCNAIAVENDEELKENSPFVFTALDFSTDVLAIRELLKSNNQILVKYQLDSF